MQDNSKKFERYSRQILLKNFGVGAQQKLLHSKVLVIGAGGLGCSALQYLAAAGTGTLGIIDDDLIALNNLHRQILYSENDLGAPKALIAKEKLLQLNSDINIISYCERLTTDNALKLFSEFDVIVDGTDNFASRYLINDACVLMDKPLIYGAVSEFEGQLAVFNFGLADHVRSANYRDLFPNPPKDHEIKNCEESGVLGVLPGMIGVMQANETIKVITGIGEPLTNTVLNYNALNNRFYEIHFVADEKSKSHMPTSEAAFKQMDYEWFCSSEKNKSQISVEMFDQLAIQNNVDIVDVRESGEIPFVTEFNHIHIPIMQIAERASELRGDTILVFCQTGNRSLLAVKLLAEIFGGSKAIYELQGGILNWMKKRN